MSQASHRPGSAKLGVYGFGIVALVCAGSAAYLVSRLVEARGMKQEQRLPVVVTTRDISAGETITREALRVASYPESNVPAGAVKDLESLFKSDKAPIAATGLLAGEPLMAVRLADPALGTAIAARVQPGFRAVAVKVDNSVARAGLLYPGARVDVVGTVRVNKTYESYTRISVENVKVLSVESRTDVETYQPKRVEGDGREQTASERQDTVVTIELTPRQAEMVKLAEREGKVDLALRNASDTAEAQTTGISPTKLAQTGAQSAAAPSEPGKRSVRRAEIKRVAGSREESVKVERQPEIETYRAR
jgi:pilus assembly protein CpaB